jgi:transposase-like protein
LCYALSYRDVEELLAERGVIVDHVSVYRWVQRFTPLPIDATRPCRHTPGDRWCVDETSLNVSKRWVYLYWAIDQFGQIIDVLVSTKQDLAATRRFVTPALQHSPASTEVPTDRAPAYPRVLDELLPAACHVTEQYQNNPIEVDHGRLKSRLRPRAQTAVLCSSDLRRARLRSKPPPRPLRTWHRRRFAAPDLAFLHRTRCRYLSPGPQRPTCSPCDNASAPLYVPACLCREHSDCKPNKFPHYRVTDVMLFFPL